MHLNRASIHKKTKSANCGELPRLAHERSNMGDKVSKPTSSDGKAQHFRALHQQKQYAEPRTH